MVILTNLHRVPFQIDEEDCEAVSHFVWYFNAHKGYIGTNVRDGKRWKGLYLHQFLLGKAPVGFEWDHKNQDKLDNRRDNLRVLTHGENMCNMPMRHDNTSGVVGVYKAVKGSKKWRALIILNRERIHLGYFDTIEEAAKARRDAELEIWGGLNARHHISL